MKVFLFDVTVPMLFLGFLLGGIFGGAKERGYYEEKTLEYETLIKTRAAERELLEKNCEARVVRVENINPPAKKMYGDSDSFFLQDTVKDCPKCDCNKNGVIDESEKIQPVKPKTEKKIDPKNDKKLFIEDLKQRVDKIKIGPKQNNDGVWIPSSQNEIDKRLDLLEPGHRHDPDK